MNWVWIVEAVEKTPYCPHRVLLTYKLCKVVPTPSETLLFCLLFAFAYLGLFITALTSVWKKVDFFLFRISRVGYIEDKISC